MSTHHLLDGARKGKGIAHSMAKRDSNNSSICEKDSVGQVKQESSPTVTELRHDTVGIAQYLHACEKHEGTPIPAIIRQLPNGTINLSHRGLGTQEVKLFSTGLQVSPKWGAWDLNRNISLVLLYNRFYRRH